MALLLSRSPSVAELGTVGTLIAYDLVSGATQYQADRLMGRSKGYRVLGLREGITVVGYLRRGVSTHAGGLASA